MWGGGHTVYKKVDVGAYSLRQPHDDVAVGVLVATGQGAVIGFDAQHQRPGHRLFANELSHRKKLLDLLHLSAVGLAGSGNRGVGGASAGYSVSRV